MAPTYSNGQEMVSIYLIKIKITTKFFKLTYKNLIYLLNLQISLYIVCIDGRSICTFLSHLFMMKGATVAEW